MSVLEISVEAYFCFAAEMEMRGRDKKPQVQI